MLLTWHNLTYYQDLMAILRGAIVSGTLETVARQLQSQSVKEEAASD
jgi:queuine tRNA-ribosyltransferase